MAPYKGKPSLSSRVASFALALSLLWPLVAMAQERAVGENTENEIEAPPVGSDTMIQTARERISPIKRCQPGAAGEIVVCGDDTQENRLSPELRAIAGVGQSTRDSIPRAPEARAMTLDKLPYNWMGRDGILFPRAKPNPLLAHVKAMEEARAADAAKEAEVAPSLP